MLTLLATITGCQGAAPCEENVGAQTLEQRVEVEIGDASVLAELADDTTQRERGWRKRACGREALLLVPDQPEPLPVWGCELVDPLDVLGIRDGRVVFIERLSPCGPPCGDCPTVGDGIPVNGTLEVLAGALDVDVGAPVSIP